MTTTDTQKRKPRRPRAVAAPRYPNQMIPVDIRGAAKLLGKTYTTMRNYQARGKMPDADCWLGESPGWFEPTLLEWDGSRRKLPSRLPDATQESEGVGKPKTVPQGKAAKVQTINPDTGIPA